MDFHISSDWRSKRTHLNYHMNGYPTTFGPMHYPVASYCTDAVNKNMNIDKSDLREIITGEVLINNLHNLQNPLQKNLGEIYNSNNIKTPGKLQNSNLNKENMYINQTEASRREPDRPTMASITNFVSRMINSVTEAMPFVFQRRVVHPNAPIYTKYPNSGLKEGVDDFFQGSPPLAQTDYISKSTPEIDIVNRVIIEKYTNNLGTPPCKTTNTSTEEIFEDAFTPEDFAHFNDKDLKTPNNTMTITEKINIAEPLPVNEKTEPIHVNNVNKSHVPPNDCIDKCLKLPLTNINNINMDKEDHKRSIKINTTKQTKTKSPCKKFKNLNRLCEKRKKGNMLMNIKDDMCFANEIDEAELSNIEESPINSPIEKQQSPKFNCFFDELKGRFRRNSTTDSEDSFQIVFSDSPIQSPRSRKVSDCDSEDSFIVFEDDPYTSNDIFDDSDSDDSVFSDTNVNLLNCNMANMSRTISDLTDESLYEDAPSNEIAGDEVDCAVPFKNFDTKGPEVRRKVGKNGLPLKKVRFSERPPVVHVMRVWTFAARQARAGHWEQHALDRERFKRRIADVDMAISWVLKPQHRARVKFQRFMPWWHAQRRQEAAEKKLRDEEEEKMKLEEDTKITEEENKVTEEEIKANEEENKNKSQNDEHVKTKDSIVHIITDLDRNDTKVDEDFKTVRDAGVL